MMVITFGCLLKIFLANDQSDATCGLIALHCSEAYCTIDTPSSLECPLE
jgi:hypothetical protein